LFAGLVKLINSILPHFNALVLISGILKSFTRGDIFALFDGIFLRISYLLLRLGICFSPIW
jgi:hypothetical protein